MKKKFLNCQQCGGEMVQSSVKDGLGLIFSIFLLLFGLAICFTGIGAILGIPLVVYALVSGGKRAKVWKCKNCKFFIPRA